MAVLNLGHTENDAKNQLLVSVDPQWIHKRETIDSSNITTQQKPIIADALDWAKMTLCTYIKKNVFKCNVVKNHFQTF